MAKCCYSWTVPHKRTGLVLATCSFQDLGAHLKPGMPRIPSGNTVISHVVGFGGLSFVELVVGQLRDHVMKLPLDKFGSKVLDQCMLNSSDTSKNVILGTNGMTYDTLGHTIG